MIEINYEQRQIKKLRKKYPDADRKGLKRIYQIEKRNEGKENMEVTDVILINLYSDKRIYKALKNNLKR